MRASKRSIEEAKIDRESNSILFVGENCLAQSMEFATSFPQPKFSLILRNDRITREGDEENSSFKFEIRSNDDTE